MKTTSLVVFAAFCLPMAAHAQAPQVEKNVSMAMAQAIIVGAVEECAKTSFRVSDRKSVV